MTNIEKLTELARKHGISYNPGGWMADIDKEILASFLLNLKNADANLQVAEVGVFQGGSSLIYLLALPNCTFHAIDNFQGGPVSKEFTSLRNGFEEVTKPFKGRIFIYEGDSIKIGENWDRQLDVCMIDGDHNGDFPRRDIFNFMTNIKKGGYIIVDDCDMNMVKKAWTFFLKDNPQFEFIMNTSALGGKIVIFRRIR